MEKADLEYTHTLAQDLVRDGEALELWEGDTQIAEVFYSDRTRSMTFTAWKQDLPIMIVEELIEAAKRRLSSLI